MSRSKSVRSLNDALVYLCKDLVAVAHTKTLGDNCLVIGDGGRFAKISAAESGISYHWNSLLIEIFIDEKKLTSYRVRFNDPSFAEAKEHWTNPNVEPSLGGHLWQTEGNLSWYVWKPEYKWVCVQVMSICRFHGCFMSDPKVLIPALTHVAQELIPALKQGVKEQR